MQLFVPDGQRISSSAACLFQTFIASDVWRSPPFLTTFLVCPLGPLYVCVCASASYDVKVLIAITDTSTYLRRWRRITITRSTLSHCALRLFVNNMPWPRDAEGSQPEQSFSLSKRQTNNLPCRIVQFNPLSVRVPLWNYKQEFLWMGHHWGYVISRQDASITPNLTLNCTFFKRHSF